MKKICFVTTISMTLKAFILELAAYLHEEGGYEVTFICSPDEGFAKRLPAYIRYIPVPIRRGIGLDFIVSIFRLYRIFRQESFDLVQYATPNASFCTAIAAKGARIPVRLYCQWGIAYTGFTGLKRYFFKLAEQMICRLSTQAEPDSFGNLRFGRKEGLYGDENSSVVHFGSAGGVNLHKFDISRKDEWRREIRTRCGMEDGAFAAGFVGRITRDKGINELFSVCREIGQENTDFYLMLVGEREQAGIDEDLLAWSQNEKRVIYCGRTDSVEKYLAAMDLFILPSYREGFGSVVIEAEAMGVPVIVTNIPGPTEAMREGETGLVAAAKSADSLYEGMMTLYRNAALRERMGREGASFVKERFEQKELFHNILMDRNRLLQRGD